MGIGKMNHSRVREYAGWKYTSGKDRQCKMRSILIVYVPLKPSGLAAKYTTDDLNFWNAGLALISPWHYLRSVTSGFECLHNAAHADNFFNLTKSVSGRSPVIQQVWPSIFSNDNKTILMRNQCTTITIWLIGLLIIASCQKSPRITVLFLMVENARTRVSFPGATALPGNGQLITDLASQSDPSVCQIRRVWHAAGRNAPSLSFLMMLVE